MLQAYKDFWKNTFNFKGREESIQFWQTMVINFMVAILSYTMSMLLAFVIGFDVIEKNNAMLILAMLPYMLYVLVSFIPTVSICIRRLHDTNKSGWWLLLSLIPLIGGILVLVLMTFPTIKENNKY